MKRNARALRLFAVMLFIGLVASIGIAPAAIDLSTGIRYAMPTGTIDDCGTKAQAALGKYLQNVTEASPGSHEYIGTGPLGATSAQALTSSGTIHCYPAVGGGSGYEVTFTCTAETPNNPYTAKELCLDLLHNIIGQPETALPTPTPEPTGCTTANLIGTWQSDKDNTVLKMTPDGSLTDGDGVSGNWILYNGTATITYYGNHTMKLSPDGKHLSGDGYSFTRKC